MYNELLRKYYQKQFDLFKKCVLEIPPQGWIRTIRDFFGMTTSQFAKKLHVHQSRIVRLEANEKNVKISTMENIANALNCNFVYAFIPRENINDTLYNLAKKKALKILNRVNHNMNLENQLIEKDEILEGLIAELLDGNVARLWDDEVKND